MDKELQFFLEQGPTTVKELARLTGKSTSGIYKALKADGVIAADSDKGKVFSMLPASPVDGAGDTAQSLPTKPIIQFDEDVPAKRGRKNTAAGQKLSPGLQMLAAGETPKEKGNHYVNPRRAGSHGYRSLQIIIDHPGITTEEYIAKGGRLNDLRWDLAHGNVRTEA